MPIRRSLTLCRFIVCVRRRSYACVFTLSNTLLEFL
jgi:hypothetical protein